MVLDNIIPKASKKYKLRHRSDLSNFGREDMVRKCEN